jgi:hypothetical protein
MEKIANPQELIQELQGLLRSASRPRPSREKLAISMRELADKVAAKEVLIHLSGVPARVPVPIVKTIGPFAVHRSVRDTEEDEEGAIYPVLQSGTWAVAHVQSGLALATHVGKRRDAYEIAERVSAEFPEVFRSRNPNPSGAKGKQIAQLVNSIQYRL